MNYDPGKRLDRLEKRLNVGSEIEDLTETDLEIYGPSAIDEILNTEGIKGVKRLLERERLPRRHRARDADVRLGLSVPQRYFNLEVNKMEQVTKGTLINVMNAALSEYKGAMEKVAAIHSDKDIKEDVKIHRAFSVAKDLNERMTGLLNMLNSACKKAADSVELARNANSSKFDDNDYQSRLLGEVALLRNLPETMKQEDVEHRISAFFGDEMARSLLIGVLTEASESRKARGVDGFDVEAMLPDVYALQLAMLEKIRKAIADKLQNLGNSFYAGPGDIAAGKSENALMFAEGVFTGVFRYIDKLPERVKREHNGSTKVYNIPAFANDPEDLNIVFSMYRL